MHLYNDRNGLTGSIGGQNPNITSLNPEKARIWLFLPLFSFLEENLK
jgi:hypothetical protein